SKLGSAMYLMTSTRPDICFTVGVLSRFSSDPSVCHGSFAMLLCRDQASRLHLGGKDANFEAYADTDYSVGHETR
ncbi:hypothetical protein FN846DRAFT_752572, partial [Sphaerosporella brunnea]